MAGLDKLYRKAAEAALLALVFAKPELIDTLGPSAHGELFGDQIYGIAWRIVSDSWKAGRRHDLITAADIVKGKLGSEMHQAVDLAFKRVSTAETRDVDLLVAELDDAAERRRNFVQASYYQDKLTDLASDRTEVTSRHVTKLMQRADLTDVDEPIGEALHDAVEAIGRLQPQGGSIVRSGLGWLDRRLKVRRSHVILLGAIEKTGKSFFVQQLARNYAAAGKRVLWASTEMRSDDLLGRVLGSWCGFSDEELDGVYDGRDLARAKVAVDQVTRDVPIWFLYCKRPEYLLRIASQRVRTTGLDVMILDYLQDYAFPREWGDEFEAPVAMAEHVQSFAREHNVAVWVVSGMNKSQRPGAAPVPSQLLGRRRLLHLADAIVLMHRPEEREPSLISCSVPEARHTRDKRKWWLVRNMAQEYEEISSSDAAERIARHRKT